MVRCAGGLPKEIQRRLHFGKATAFTQDRELEWHLANRAKGLLVAENYRKLPG